MPVFDSNGNLKVIGNLTTDVRESGSIIVPEAGFLDFRGEGLSNVSVTTSGNGAIITISSSGDGGGSGGGGIVVASGSSGQIVTSSVDFINFTGPGVESVFVSGSGVTVTIATGSGGGGGGGITAITKGGTFLDPIIPNDVVIWRANGTYTISAIRAYLSGATASSASINTRVNTSNNLSSNLFVTTSGNWWVGDTPINTSVSSGDSLEVRLLSLSGSVKYINIQVDLTSS